MCWGDVRQDFIGYLAAAGAYLLDGQLVVLGRPGDHGVGQQGEAPCLLGLLALVGGTDAALVGVVQVTP